MMLKPVELKCEYRSNPVGIDASQPRLSWVLEADDLNARNVRQSAYQIIVSDSSGELWNSAKVPAAQHIQIPYGGKPLRSAQHLNWKVRVWNQDGAPSGWSQSANWTMGLLAPSDWKAKWITAPSAENSRQLPIFRHAFALDKAIARAVAFFCGLGQHALQINGQ